MSLSWSAARTPALLSYSTSDEQRDRPEGRSGGGQGDGEHAGGTGETLPRCSDGLGARYTREQGDKRGEVVGVVGASAEPALGSEKWLGFMLYFQRGSERVTSEVSKRIPRFPGTGEAHTAALNLAGLPYATATNHRGSVV